MQQNHARYNPKRWRVLLRTFCKSPTSEVKRFWGDPIIKAITNKAEKACIIINIFFSCYMLVSSFICAIAGIVLGPFKGIFNAATRKDKSAAVLKAVTKLENIKTSHYYRPIHFFSEIKNKLSYEKKKFPVRRAVSSYIIKLSMMIIALYTGLSVP